jgi:hypothetical protein
MLRVGEQNRTVTAQAPASSPTNSLRQADRYVLSEIPSPLPGKLFLATRPGFAWNGAKLKYDASKQASHIAQARDAGVGLMVSLLETADAGYHADCARNGIAVRRHPIRNYTVPTQREAKITVQAIINEMSAGGNVAMHCMGGKGRSGTIAACVLVQLGADAATAIRVVRERRQDSIETSEQIAFIEAFARLART